MPAEQFSILMFWWGLVSSCCGISQLSVEQVIDEPAVALTMLMGVVHLAEGAKNEIPLGVGELPLTKSKQPNYPN